MHRSLTRYDRVTMIACQSFCKKQVSVGSCLSPLVGICTVHLSQCRRALELAMHVRPCMCFQIFFLRSEGFRTLGFACCLYLRSWRRCEVRGHGVSESARLTRCLHGYLLPCPSP